eukprot:gene14540-30950_t
MFCIISPDVFSSKILFDLLEMKDICLFDTAVMNKEVRKYFLGCLQSVVYNHPMRIINELHCKWIYLRKLTCTDVSFKYGWNFSNLPNLIEICHSTLIKCDMMSCNQSYVTTDILKFLALGFDQLKDLDLSSIRRVDDEAITYFAQSCPMLSILSLSSTNITDNGISIIGKYCHQLTSLILNSCNITDKAILPLAQGCTKLLKLDISDIQDITKLGLSLLAQNCSILEELNISASNLNDECIFALCSGHLHLKILKMNNLTNINDISFKYISESFTNLEMIDISNNQNITDESLIYLSNGCHHLKEICLYQCSKIKDTGFENLCKHCPLLHTIDLSNGVTLQGIHYIAKYASNLTTLHQYCINNEFDDNYFKELSKCTSITNLNVSGCPEITDVGIQYITQSCHQITTLNIDSCKNITDISLLYIANGLPSLKELSFCGNNITNKGLEYIGHNKCKQLNIIRYSGINHITEEGKAYLPTYCTLQYIEDIYNDIGNDSSVNSSDYGIDVDFGDYDIGLTDHFDDD